MIKSIYLKRTDSIDPSEGLVKINFSDHINVIVGEKGSGKSTLFDLLASIVKGYIPKNVDEALKSYNFEFDKAEFYNGETIFSNTLSLKKESEKKEDFTNRFDVIFQDDPIKKNLNNLETIKNEKYNYAQEVIDKCIEMFNPLFDKLGKFYDEMKTICFLKNVNINWSNAFKITNDNIELNVISRLNYSSNDISLLIQKELTNLKDFVKNSNDQISFIKSNLSRMNFNLIYKDNEFEKELQTKLNNQLKYHEDLILFVNKRILTIKKIENVINIFNKVYNKKIDEIKKQFYQDQGIKTFEKQSKDYFKDFANKIYNLKLSFEELLKKEVCLEINYPAKEINLLTYKMKDKIILSDEHIIEMIKKVLYTPKSYYDFSKWILENNKPDKNFKEWDLKKIKNYIAKKFKEDDDVLVYAGDKEYSTMSLGQKSIFGIKYKFSHSSDVDLFLDQPEDNLDNNTIATTILNLIENKKNNQVFIVTHNANIGILSKPEKIIVAQLNNINNPYIEGKIVSLDEMEDNSNLTYYLEGGLEYLQRRYKIVKGE